jgi:hypothetical protein
MAIAVTRLSAGADHSALHSIEGLKLTTLSNAAVESHHRSCGLATGHHRSCAVWPHACQSACLGHAVGCVHLATVLLSSARLAVTGEENQRETESALLELHLAVARVNALNFNERKNGG